MRVTGHRRGVTVHNRVTGRRGVRVRVRVRGRKEGGRRRRREEGKVRRKVVSRKGSLSATVHADR